MDKETFTARMYNAEVMSLVSDSPDYWRGYIRGLQRAYHGESFGTKAEHALWSSLADRDDTKDHERGCGYLDGFKVDTYITSPTKAEPWLRWDIKHPAIIITILTAVMYGLGRIYYQGYWKVFGLDDTQFPLPIDSVLVYGFVPLLEGVGVFVIGFLVLAVVPLAAAYSEKIKERIEKIKERTNNWSSKRRIDSIFLVLIGLFVAGVVLPRWVLDLIINVVAVLAAVALAAAYSEKIKELTLHWPSIFKHALVTSFVFVLFMVVLNLLAQNSNDLGEEAANKLIAKCVGGDLKKAEIMLGPDINQVPEENRLCGCSIACNSNQCAYLVVSETVSETEFGPRRTTIITNMKGRIHSKINLPEWVD